MTMMHFSPAFFWMGIGLLLWVVFQSVTGKFYYRGGPPGSVGRREEGPKAFWGIMALEGVFALMALGCGLPCFPLAMAAFAILVLALLAGLLWALGTVVGTFVKYPLRLLFPLFAGLRQRTVAALEAFLVTHPGDRQTLLMLASAHEKIGRREAAWDLYTELAQTEDWWGKQARAILRAQGSGGIL
jgi:hypothetical protein